jgi:hypothetical protein
VLCLAKEESTHMFEYVLVTWLGYVLRHYLIPLSCHGGLHDTMISHLV